MFRAVTTWNFIYLNGPEEATNKTQLRGHNSRTFLTGKFSSGIANGDISSLSVGDIADYLCPSRKDLYFKKGRNRPRIKGRKTWGRVAGRAAEEFAVETFKKHKARRIQSYQEIASEVATIEKDFRTRNSETLLDLGRLKSRPDEDPDWFLRLLTYNGRAELGLRLLHEMLCGKNSREMNVSDLIIKRQRLCPDPTQIGISRSVQPDFLVENRKVVGDIKTGIGGFKDHYLLTCAGYAMAHENEKGESGDIDFGIIYFFPTRHSDYAKPISLAQVYTFPIDDKLRDYFLRVRDTAYDIISKDRPPAFPSEKDYCHLCQFLDECISRGLSL